MEDVTAGMIVAVLFIPQSMAYAVIAGVNPVIGLYAATFPLIIYTLIGSSRHLSVGPVSIVSLLAFNGVASLAEPHTDRFYQIIVMITLLVGIIQILLSICKIGRLFKHISPAVISGFTSAVAIIICLSQLDELLGVTLPSPENFQAFISGLIHHVDNINLYTFVIGISSVILLLIFKKLLPLSIGPLIIIILTTFFVHFYDLNLKGVAIIGEVPTGLPQFVLPEIKLDYLPLIFPVALAIASISFLESYAVARSIAEKEQYEINPNIELKGLGMANITSGFIGAIPVAGAFSRTAVNYQSGAKTKLSSIITVVIIMITLLYFTPYFYYLPKAALAAIIILAAYSLIDIKTCVDLIKYKQADAIIFLTTLLIALLFNIFTGLLIGLALSMVQSLFKNVVVLKI